ncbi:MAG: hypothetical protein ABSH07_03200 [Candidatus Dormibacteria bacterium]|jgi:uncharacterized membrane protein
MSPLELTLVIVGLVVGVGVGYDAERWDRNINAWSLAGAVLSVVGLAAWLAVRHQEAERRRAAGEELPPGMGRWLRHRHRPRPISTG